MDKFGQPVEWLTHACMLTMVAKAVIAESEENAVVDLIERVPGSWRVKCRKCNTKVWLHYSQAAWLYQKQIGGVLCTRVAWRPVLGCPGPRSLQQAQGGWKTVSVKQGVQLWIGFAANPQHRHPPWASQIGSQQAQASLRCVLVYFAAEKRTWAPLQSWLGGPPLPARM